MLVGIYFKVVLYCAVVTGSSMLSPTTSTPTKWHASAGQILVLAFFLRSVLDGVETLVDGSIRCSIGIGSRRSSLGKLLLLLAEGRKAGDAALAHGVLLQAGELLGVRGQGLVALVSCREELKLGNVGLRLGSRLRARSDIVFRVRGKDLVDDCLDLERVDHGVAGGGDSAGCDGQDDGVDELGHVC